MHRSNDLSAKPIHTLFSFLLTLKMLEGPIWLPTPKCGFTQNISSRERVKPWFFVSFNIISHIFPENFIEFPQVIQKIWRFSPSILTIFINFEDFLTYPCHKETNEVSILQMMSKFCWKNMKGVCGKNYPRKNYSQKTQRYYINNIISSKPFRAISRPFTQKLRWWYVMICNYHVVLIAKLGNAILPSHCESIHSISSQA